MHPYTPSPTADSYSLDFDVIERDDACVISISGEVDLSSAPRLKTLLGQLAEESGERDIILELSRLVHLDSTGLAVLIGFRRRLAATRRLVIADPSPMVSRVLTLTGLLGAFDTLASVDDAVSYLRELRSSGPELPLSPDAALTLGLAQTALPFADSYAAEALCWQRILLPHGSSETRHTSPGDATTDGSYRQRLERVVAHAGRLARERDAQAIRTGDLLRAVTTIYGSLFDDAMAGAELT